MTTENLQLNTVATPTEQTNDKAIPLKNSRAFNWCCTWNNPDMTGDEFFEFLKGLENISYFTFQLEQAKTETPHFQMYLEFAKSKYFLQLKDLLPRGTHIEQRRRTREKAKNYCQKEDSRIGDKFYEWGDFGNQGKRSDIHDIIDCVRDGWSDAEIMQTYPVAFFHYHKNIDHIRELTRYEMFSDVERHLTVNYITGETGVGKTWFITHRHGYKNVHIVDNYKHPFDRYKGQDVVVFEEFHGQGITITEMLRMLDIYPYGLPCRFKDKQACYHTVYITSNEPADKLYSGIKAEKPKTWNALMRRIHNVYNYDDPNDRAKLEQDMPNPNPFFVKPKNVPQYENGMRILTPEEEEDMPF